MSKVSALVSLFSSCACHSSDFTLNGCRERGREREVWRALVVPFSLISPETLCVARAFSADGTISLLQLMLATTLPLRARVQSHVCAGLSRNVAAPARDGGQGTFDEVQTTLQERISERIPHNKTEQNMDIVFFPPQQEGKRGSSADPTRGDL